MPGNDGGDPGDFWRAAFKNFRVSLGLNGTEFSREVGLTKNVVSAWDTGRCFPSAESWRKVKSRFPDVPPPPFFGAQSGSPIREPGSRIEPCKPPIRLDPPQSLETLRMALEAEFPGKMVVPKQLSGAELVVLFKQGESASTDLRDLEERLEVTARWNVVDGALAIMVERRHRDELRGALAKALNLRAQDLTVVSVANRTDVHVGTYDSEMLESVGQMVEAAALAGALEELASVAGDRMRVLAHVTLIRVNRA